MLTSTTTRAKRKLILNPQTLGVLTGISATGANEPRSTNQTNQASCTCRAQDDEQQQKRPNPPQDPPAPPRRS